MNERTISEVLAHWRQQCELRKEEKKRLKMVEELHRRNTLRKYVNMWKNSIKSKWKAKVEKVCKERATEICIKERFAHSSQQFGRLRACAYLL